MFKYVEKERKILVKSVKSKNKKYIQFENQEELHDKIENYNNKTTNNKEIR